MATPSSPPPPGVPQQGYGHPQQPGPYGQPPQQPPYGAGPGAYPPPPPPASGGGKKTALILGAVAVVAAIGVGAYFVFGGGGSAIADDGPHKLVTPETVLGEYKKNAGGESGSSSDDDFKDAEKWGVKNAKEVEAAYQSGDESNPFASKMLQFGGVYGDIEDPEKVVDAFFAHIKSESEKEPDAEGKLVGSPQTYEPAGLENAVLKCQQLKGDTGASAGEGPKDVTLTVCVWGDHSTVGVVMPIDMAGALTGKGGDPAAAAETAAKLRKEVRVKV
ncbi:hypothetical protein [Streptomyces ficellus]|uniref:hypothetical protein n=1 Tax=Streptomyces ficellus TaxID=1977088 RepID=UPI00338EDBDD